jgi:hypothetical protein
MWKILALLTLVALLQIGGATLIDLGEYILSTGEYIVYNPNFVNLSNETTGEYAVLGGFGTGDSSTYVWLSEGLSKINESNLTALGYEKVAKPYPGFIHEDQADGTVSYICEAKDGLQLTIVFSSKQAAIDILPQITIIPREEYDASKSEELRLALA